MVATKVSELPELLLERQTPAVCLLLHSGEHGEHKVAGCSQVLDLKCPGGTNFLLPGWDSMLMEMELKSIGTQWKRKKGNVLVVMNNPLHIV